LSLQFLGKCLALPKLALNAFLALAVGGIPGIDNAFYSDSPAFASFISVMYPAVMIPAGSATIAMPKMDEIIVTALPKVVTG
jgi:hypothetical protein